MQALDPKLSILQPEIFDSSINNIQYVVHPCKTLPGRLNPVEFEIRGNDFKYIDLSQCKLLVRYKILKKDGAVLVHNADDPDAGDFVATTNLPLVSLFRKIDVHMNQYLINSGCGVDNGYRGYIDVLVNSAPEDVKYKLTAENCYFDNSDDLNEGAINMPNINMDNDGITARYAYTQGSKLCEVFGPLRTDVTGINRLLVPGISLSVKLHQAPDAFRLLSNDDTKGYYLDIKEAYMYVPYVTLMPDVDKALTSALTKSNAIYPMDYSEIKTYQIDKGLYRQNFEDIFLGRIPNHLYVCTVSSKAYNGSLDTNPFDFQHFNCSQIDLQVDGLSFPSDALTMDFKNDKYSRVYEALFSENNRAIIDKGAFKRGYALYSFPLRSHRTPGITVARSKGNLRLSMSFKKALPEAITVIIYAKFDACLQFDCHKSLVKQ